MVARQGHGSVGLLPCEFGCCGVVVLACYGPAHLLLGRCVFPRLLPVYSGLFRPRVIASVLGHALGAEGTSLLPLGRPRAWQRGAYRLDALEACYRHSASARLRLLPTHQAALWLSELGVFAESFCALH